MESKAKSTIMTRLEEMKALATEEAVKLKEHATKEELGKLNLKRLDPRISNTCIYGQMTGYCSGQRANELIMLCANRVYNVRESDTAQDAKLNGEPHQIAGDKTRHAYYQSPIEILIYDENGGKGDAAKLISFLKDETQTLEL